MSATIQSVLGAGVARLAAAGVADPARDGRLFMAEALGIASARLTLVAGEPIGSAARGAFETLVAARADRRPVAQILGRRAFWGRDFEVTGDVLDPRPETETLVALALAGSAPSCVLDLGTGSGVILLTLLAEWPRARGTGTDTSAAALAVAARNAELHGLADRAVFRRADWAAGVKGRFDLVVSNPPYIPAGEIAGLAADVRDWEPPGALTAGPTGLEAYARIAPGLAGLLAPGGRALFEFGANQGTAVAAIFRRAGFADPALHPDLDGRPRVLSLG